MASRADQVSEKKGGAWSAWLLLLISPVMLFLGLGGAPAAAPSAPARPPGQAEEAPGDPGSHCVERFLAPLQAIAYPVAPRAPPVDPSTVPWFERLRTTLYDVRETLGESAALDAYVATVADPLDSGLGYQFDTSLKALRDGFEAAVPEDGGRFHRDRSWLPWDDRDVSGDAREKSQACRKSMPGLVLFRGGTASAPRLRALLLVGETPTSGAYRAALVSALGVAELFGAANPSPVSSLGVIGPSFSGSAQSLRFALEHWGQVRNSAAIQSVRITTGSATSGSLAAVLDSGGASAGSFLRGASVEFSRTTPVIGDLQCRYLKFVSYRQVEQSSDGVLRSVALLHESGTEFGATLQRDGQGGRPAEGSRCLQDGRDLRAGLDLAFPVHIGKLRDAYEEMDRAVPGASGPEPVGRRTALDVSLREKHAPREGEADPSPKTTYAEDLAVAHLLGVLARSSVSHVAIQATDVADAIFLARKIRDVAPDVRLAFFGSDVLLLHPSFQRDLKGSIVVSAYPFFGAHDFLSRQSDPERRFLGFEGTVSQGIYNAVLASRGAAADALSDYVFTDHRLILPIWVAAIGGGKLIPISLRPNDSDVYGKPRPPPAQAGTAPDYFRQIEKQSLSMSRLLLPEDVRFPRFWHFLFGTLVLGFFVDQLHQRRAYRALSGTKLASIKDPAHAAAADLAIITTKWELYAAIRSFVVAMALSFMAYVYWFTFGLYGEGFDAGHVSAIVISSVLALAAVACALVRTFELAEDYVALGRAVGGGSFLISTLNLGHRILRRTEPPSSAFLCAEAKEKLSRWDRFTLSLGLARADTAPAAALSFYQLRTLANLSMLVSIAFVTIEGFVLWSDAELPGPSRTLMVTRSLELISSVSPAAPTLLCLALAYLWAFGRMARLEVVHGLSRVTPLEGMERVVSTPIRFVLHPHHTNSVARDEALGRVERRVVNSVVRPITGPDYCTALGILAFFPILLFWLKPVSTLERTELTYLLMCGLGLGVFLIANTLVQLVQYWLSLQELLNRVLQHRLGRSFVRVARFVRDTLEQQVSRAPYDLLRLGACAARFDELVRFGTRLDAEGHGFAASERQKLREIRSKVVRLRAAAVTGSVSVGAAAVKAEIELGREVIAGAHELMKVLIEAWEGRLVPTTSPVACASDPPPLSGVAAPSEVQKLRAQILATEEAPTTLRASGAPVGMIVATREPVLAARTGASGPRAEARDGTPEPARSVPTPALATAVAYQVATAPESEPPQPHESAGAKGSLSMVVPASRGGGERRTLSDQVWLGEATDDALSAEGWRYTRNELTWLREAESFVATVVAVLISRHVRQFQHFVQTLTLCSLVLLLAVLSYPFEPHRLLLTFVVGVVLSVVIVGFWVYVGLDRSTILSHIAGSEPGKLTLDGALLQRVIAWGFVPLLVIAAAQYPDVANALMRLADPVLRSLR